MSHPHITDERLKSLPKLPGVYLMRDGRGEVIYIGKAKSLRSRVRSYFSGQDTRHSVPFILERVEQIETLVTEDERQALILESDLVKQHMPRYNVRLKDDKAYLYVRIDLAKDWPRLELVRFLNEDGAKYFGPYPFSYEIRTVLEVIKRTLPLRTCSDRTLVNRVRPCLEYQIKRCAGPCCLDVDRVQYLGWVEQAMELLEGRSDAVIEQLENQMARASSELRFEDAATIRDRLEILTRLANDRPAVQFGEGARDAVGWKREEDRLEISVLSVRQGRLFGSKTYGFTDVAAPDVEMLSSLLVQFYQGRDEIPAEIILPFKLEDSEALSELLSERRDGKVSLLIPKRGSKARLLSLAQENAAQNFAARASEVSRHEEALKDLQRELNLPQAPRTIECVDISHFQGQATVASVVFFKDGEPDKTRYRHFHVHLEEEKPDDFASMRDVVARHLSRGAEENTLCDLMIIDGGVGQLSQAVRERDALGLTTPTLVGLAKKRGADAPYRMLISGTGAPQRPERIYLEGADVPVVLKAGSPAMNLLERIRNEAHRFAIGFHRSTRSRQVLTSPLEKIPGIGPKRRKLLLQEFGSLDGIREATLEELMSRGKLTEILALRIQEGLNKNS